jgi:hypothetical protein
MLKHLTLQSLGALVILQFMAMPAAWACDGQPGSLVYEDTFADDSGGWDETPPSSLVKPPAYVFTLDATTGSVAAQVLTFHTTDGDFCMQIALPKPTTPDNTPAAGIEFWAVDYSNLMLAQLTGLGNVSLFSRTSGTWQALFSVNNAPGFKPDPGAVNDLRVNAVGGKIAVYLNGTQIKVIRAQIPTGMLRFGMFASWVKSADGSPPITVTSYKVTSGQ